MIENREVRIFNPETISKPNGYSHVAEVTSGKLVYIAGQVAMDKDGQIVGKGDFGSQVRQVFVNLEAALKAVGGSFSDVVKLNCYVVDGVDRRQLPVFRQTRDEFVTVQSPPVSTLVFVSSLVNPELLVEVEAVAVV